MPNTAPITLVVGAASTVFSPESVTPTHVQFQNNATSEIDQRELLHFDRPPNNKTTVRRSIRLNKPLVREMDGKVSLLQGSGKVEFVFPLGSTILERNEIRLMLAAAITNSVTTAIVDQPEWFW